VIDKEPKLAARWSGRPLEFASEGIVQDGKSQECLVFTTSGAHRNYPRYEQFTFLNIIGKDELLYSMFLLCLEEDFSAQPLQTLARPASGHSVFSIFLHMMYPSA